jgi:hypothetical protein
MAYSQQVPKENPARNNKHVVITLPRRTDDKLIGPDLPKGKAWHEETKKWWDTWRKHPIAPMLEETDWNTLKRTAILHSDFWFGLLPPTQQVSYAAEIRRVETMYGATVEDRLKLRMKFVDSDGTPNGSNDNGTPKNPQVDYSALLGDEDDS